MASESSLLDELSEFVLPSATLRDGKPLGAGSYAKVVEVEIPGAICAAKILHESLVHTQTYVRDRFVAECKLMSTPRLRHPRIVQFIGLCPVPNSPFPALVMERMHCSLDDVLESNPMEKRILPLGLKRSILHDVSEGLFFLHSFRPDPIVHRDLSAKNILLNSAMQAKIADFGVARIIDRIGMTAGPGTLPYMPPEAIGSGTSTYSTPIDVFSFGVLALYTVIQEFPRDLPPASYTSSALKSLITRTEVDRRQKYFDSLKLLLGKNHRLVALIQECLANNHEVRPTIENVSRDLEALVIPNDYETSTKLDLIQMVEELKKEENETNALKKQLESQLPLEHGSKITWKRVKDMPFGVKAAFAVVLDGRVYVGGGDADTEVHEHVILVYDPERDAWSELKQCSPKEYAMAGFQSELVVVGGRVAQQSDVPGRVRPSVASCKVLVWNKHSGEWCEPYPHMPESERRWFASAVGYKHYLIVVGGRNYNESKPKTLVFDSSCRQWHLTSLQLPFSSKRMPLTVFSDTLYIFSGGAGNQACSLPLLSLVARSQEKERAAVGVDGSHLTTAAMWKKLSCTVCSVTSESFANRIIVVGGCVKSGGQGTDRICYYDNASEKWENFSTRCSPDFKLPFPRSRFAIASLPDRQLFIAGGYEHSEERDYHNDVYIGTVSVA